ncbi:flagellar hook-basal body complex protein [Falsiroseomonas sp. HW251]|uniref:flagellar hook-basal body complex protein n=1 Tax=Falsiroseomonas sp. HW251 TaxID=3390998 RepID=UPI003D32226E
MDSPGYIVLSRLVAAQRMTAVTANNIANADTPGFRASRPVFGTMLERQVDADAPRGGRELAFAQDRATWRDGSAAPLQRTGNPLDVALSDQDAFLAVATPRGERYTRAGRFSLDVQGRVVDPDGNAVLGTNGQPIRLEPGSSRIEIRGDGSVSTEAGPVGQLRIVRFDDVQRLRAEGERNFAAPEGQQAQPVERPGVVQGTVEGSNVRPVLELTRLTEDLRQFQFVSQMAEREGERLGTVVERVLRRR